MSIKNFTNNKNSLGVSNDPPTNKLTKAKKTIPFILEVMALSGKTRKEVYAHMNWTRARFSQYVTQGLLPPIGKREKLRKYLDLDKEVYYAVLNKHLMRLTIEAESN